MNTKKLFFAIFTMSIFLIGSCTTDNADNAEYEVGVNKKDIDRTGVDKKDIEVRPGGN